MGPSCPVVQVNTPCPDRPWEGVVAVRDETGREITRTMTDAAGRFRFDLAPGDYILVTLTQGFLPSPATMSVTVVAGEVTEVQLLLDSGIR